MNKDYVTPQVNFREFEFKEVIMTSPFSFERDDIFGWKSGSGEENV